MLNQSRLPICRLSDIFKPVSRKFLSMVPGPKTPPKPDPQSPKGWRNRESDGVGLAIVVALETKDRFVASPVNITGSSRDEFRCSWRCHEKEEEEEEDEEEEESGGPFCGPDDDGFRPADFLRSCYLCRKKLDGIDIFIYRGDRGFCSMECRYQHIVSEEFREKCGAELVKSSENITKPSYADDHRLFFMDVAAS